MKSTWKCGTVRKYFELEPAKLGSSSSVAFAVLLQLDKTGNSKYLEAVL